jgi:ubiquinone/menaquinone biosynthesis C-methylase UbiE
VGKRLWILHIALHQTTAFYNEDIEMDSTTLAQRKYYAETAKEYDEMHGLDVEHQRAIDIIIALSKMSGARSILDVGCGTGRGLLRFLDSGLSAKGIEPVQELLNVARKKNVPDDCIYNGVAERLPFSDGEFDVACELGVFHHIKNPKPALHEMMRVASKAIFLSDENRFAYGSPLRRVSSLALAKMKIFDYAYYLKTLGKGHRYSDGDGVAYSYSVYDAYDELYDWADRIFFIPTSSKKPRKTWNTPLTNSFHVLLCAIRDRPID